MNYQGSKARFAKYLLPILTKKLNGDRWYVEPFCGGCNIIDKVNHPLRLAADSNNYLIAMWRFLINYNFGSFPQKIDKHLYDYYRGIFNKRGFKGDAYKDTEALIGWVGFMASYNGRFFDGGYCGNAHRDYINEHIQNVLAQKELLRGVQFACCTYDKLDIPQNSVIYCDIPYANTKQYATSRNFDYGKFWDWAEGMTRAGHDVFVSEYNAPSNFVSIWDLDRASTMCYNHSIIATERLFVHASIAGDYI